MLSPNVVFSCYAVPPPLSRARSTWVPRNRVPSARLARRRDRSFTTHRSSIIQGISVSTFAITNHVPNPLRNRPHGDHVR
ncbi:hypothetical protein BD309DRAFT_969067 [Dichomitus squalens]|nr:hypothetical protein BD309DRAFT_969067 [Dichomitus squalens]